MAGQRSVEAVYEGGALRPLEPLEELREGQRVRLVLVPDGPHEPDAASSNTPAGVDAEIEGALEARIAANMEAAARVNRGLLGREIEAIEAVILDGRPFFSERTDQV